LESGIRVAILQPRRGSMRQVHKWPESHESSLGKQLVGLVVFSFLLASCTPNARIVNESSTGGTVLYSYVEAYDVLTSSGRKDAIRLLDEKCPTGTALLGREKFPESAKLWIERGWDSIRGWQVSREKDWAIQFVCK